MTPQEFEIAAGIAVDGNKIALKLEDSLLNFISLFKGHPAYGFSLEDREKTCHILAMRLGAELLELEPQFFFDAVREYDREDGGAREFKKRIVAASARLMKPKNGSF